MRVHDPVTDTFRCAVTPMHMRFSQSRSGNNLASSHAYLLSESHEVNTLYITWWRRSLDAAFFF